MAGLLSCLCRADDPTSPVSPVPAVSAGGAESTVAELLRQLGARSLRQRMDAERKLRELGPAVLDSLPPPDLLRDVAVRQAVARVRSQLERQAAQQSVAGSRVTLKGTFRVRDVVAGIAAQTRNAVDVADESGETHDAAPGARSERRRHDEFDRELTVDWNGQLFWKVIGELEQLGFQAIRDDDSPQLVLHAVDPPVSDAEVRRQVSQAFRISVQAPRQRSIDGSSRAVLRIPLTLEAEPRLRPLFLRCRMNDFIVVAGERPLAPFSPDSSIEVPLGDGGRDVKLELPFLASAPVTGSLGLSGRVTLVTAALERDIEFPDVLQASGRTRRRGGVTVTVAETGAVPAAVGRHAVRVAVRVGYDSGTPAFESHQTWVFHNLVYLQDQQGRRYHPAGGYRTLFHGDGTVGVEYRFQGLPEKPDGWSFVYVAPTLLIGVPLQVNIECPAVIEAR